ncbi:MAG: hypothetical protein JXR48_00510 [Candidatus Delongbacteria bacterium]|nr:hypothetical protein [Candidatus Delongbacteria bacterium]MBN2833423.1 hypothetical protein [Candidatus Delongbacteria bacterium]
MDKILNKISILVIPFTLLSIYFMISGTYLYDYIIMDDINKSVLFCGIAFAFGSMKDIKILSTKEKKKIQNVKLVKRTKILLSLLTLSILIVSSVFMSIKFIPNMKNGDDFFDLGINCFPLFLALIFELKQFTDKVEYHKLLKNNE